MKLDFDRDELEYKLDTITAESIQPLEIDSACKLALRALVLEGVERMELEGHVAEEDVAMACANLRRDSPLTAFGLRAPADDSPDAAAAASE